MKLAIVALLSFFAAQSQATFIPGYERPVYSSELKEVSVDTGHRPTSKTTLTINRKDGANKYTSMTLTENFVRYCVVAPCPQPTVSHQFRITSKSVSPHNVVTYFATEMVNHSEPMLIILKDSSASQLPVVTNQWDVTVQGFRFERKYLGTPSPVYTIQ